MSKSKPIYVLLLCLFAIPETSLVRGNDDDSGSLEDLESITKLESDSEPPTPSDSSAAAGLEALAAKLQSQLRSESQKVNQELKSELRQAEKQHQHREWELEQKLKQQEWKTKQAESKLEALSRKAAPTPEKSMERQLMESNNFLVDGRPPQDGIYLIRDPKAPTPPSQPFLSMEREPVEERKDMQAKMASTLASQLGAEGISSLTSSQANRALRAIEMMKQRGLTTSHPAAQDVLSQQSLSMEVATKPQEASITAEDMKPFRGMLEEVIDNLNHIGTKRETHPTQTDASKQNKGDSHVDDQPNKQNKVEITIKTN